MMVVTMATTYTKKGFDVTNNVLGGYWQKAAKIKKFGHYACLDYCDAYRKLVLNLW